MNSANIVFKNNYLMQKIYEYDNTYHIIYHDILDICYSAFKNHWNKKLKKINNIKENDILYIDKNNLINKHWEHFYISCKFNLD